MADTVATTMTSRRVSKELVAECRSRSTSSLSEESFRCRCQSAARAQAAGNAPDGVAGEELAKFVRELCCQRLVRLHHQDWTLQAFREPGDGGRLAGARGTQQNDAVRRVDPLLELLDCLGLVT